MPSPDLKIGTMATLDGLICSVSYEMFRGVLSCIILILRYREDGQLSNKLYQLTVPDFFEFKHTANASTPMMVAISLTRLRVSRVDVDWERSWESLALRQGWEDIWTLVGREDIVIEIESR